MASPAPPALRRIVIAACAVSLLAGAPLTLARVARRIGTAVRYLGEDARGARVRHLGKPMVATIDAIRRAVPADGAYLLIDGGEEYQAAAYWVRFELAPRRPILAGRWRLLRDRPTEEWLPPRPPRWTVLALPDAPPLLLYRAALLALHRTAHGSG
jgi:hypothetical protein